MAHLTGQEASKQLDEICGMAPVVPVLIVEDAGNAADLGTALIQGGLPVLEVTLRSEAALESISEMAKLKGGIVGAGTLLRASDVHAAKEAGARFGVSPGATDEVVQACEEAHLPLLAGAVTASEVMNMLSRGYRLQKFFPAEAAGGAKAVGSFASPLSEVQFCPTGGISASNAEDYLKLTNVACVGGSWVAPKEAVNQGDWAKIEELAKVASKLG